METQKKRLQDFILYLKISVRAFERSIGVSGSTVRLAKDNLSANLIDKTCKTYPILSRIWLLTGEGEMIKHTEKPTFGYTTNNGDVGNQNIGTGTQIINPAEDTAGLKATIEKQQKEILDLKIENAKLQGMIEILKEK